VYKPYHDEYVHPHTTKQARNALQYTVHKPPWWYTLPKQLQQPSRDERSHTITVSNGQFYNFQLTVIQYKWSLTPQTNAERERNHLSRLSRGRTVTAGIRATNRTIFVPINVPVNDDGITRGYMSTTNTIFKPINIPVDDDGSYYTWLCLGHGHNVQIYQRTSRKTMVIYVDMSIPLTKQHN
jgi:hypothetical protein